MLETNKTVVKEFILFAFADLQQIQNLLVFVFLLNYILCILGNMAIIIIIRVDPSLHTVMYFFIGVFSVLEIMLVTVIVPKLLANVISGNNIISFTECFTQMYIFISSGSTECYLLAVMAFDRHLAINNPLHYQAIMTPAFYISLAVLPWIMAFSIILAPVITTAQLDYCGPNVIDHFYCDVAPLQNLACSDVFISNIATLIASMLIIILAFITIIGFYIQIIMTVSRIKSKEGKQKAFSTCSSHLIIAGLFYGTGTIVYVKPKGGHYDKYLTFMYTVITPMSNPFIYTFRNRDIKKAFRNLINNLIKPVQM
ncbi:olfactory receptor 11H4-like [Pseudophryne corroboree]|uniref:olfactory receptor 11H4-like n=1 Tax=Pseudophryne corroboree TaxID=495146 RepID=UPI003081AE62